MGFRSSLAWSLSNFHNLINMNAVQSEALLASQSQWKFLNAVSIAREILIVVVVVVVVFYWIVRPRSRMARSSASFCTRRTAARRSGVLVAGTKMSASLYVAKTVRPEASKTVQGPG